MSQKSKVIFAALAAVAAFGAVQIASVEASPTLADRFQALGDPAGAAGINRTAKGDRDANIPQAQPTRTVLLKVDSLADTSLTLALAPRLVRSTSRVEPGAGEASGVEGDPKRASAELGQLGVDLIVSKSVSAIRKSIETSKR
jgi:hypothetical protein